MMRSTTSIPNMNWTGTPSERKTYLRMVQISVTSLGIIARRIYNGEAADDSNTSMAWSIYCMLSNGRRFFDLKKQPRFCSWSRQQIGQLRMLDARTAPRMRAGGAGGGRAGGAWCGRRS